MESQEAVQWADTVCGALVPVVDRLKAPPGFDLTAPAATRDAYSSYLGAALAATDGAQQTITAAGPAPVDGGDQVAQKVRDQVTELRNDLSDAKDQVDRADPNDANALGRAAVGTAEPGRRDRQQRPGPGRPGREPAARRRLPVGPVLHAAARRAALAPDRVITGAGGPSR